MFSRIARMSLWSLVLGLVTATVAPAAAPFPSKSGVLKVEDTAKLFSEKAIKEAKDEFAVWVSSKTSREVTVWTVEKPDDATLTKLEATKDEAAKNAIWTEFVIKHVKTDGERGIDVFISRKPGHVHVITDHELQRKGFTKAKEAELRTILTKGLREAFEKKSDEDKQPIRDKTLKNAIKYLEDNLPAGSKDFVTTKKAEEHGAPAPVEKQAGGNLGSFLCVGLIVLGVGWILFAIIRAVIRMASGNAGGGYGAPGYGPAYGGAPGGGMGFFGTFLTGMVGAAAGMWMYNNFFGGHTSSAFGGDTGYGSSGTESIDDTGAGDFSGDTGTGGDYDTGGGGDFGGGDAGGGDFGGDF